jgi:hypothetical protein
VISASKSAALLFGICAITWAIDVSIVYQKERPLIDIARRIFSGEEYSDAQLNGVIDRTDLTEVRPRQAAAATGDALVRLVLLERKLTITKGGLLSESTKVKLTVDEALARSPTNSFMWLASYWLKHLSEGADHDLNLLAMSYRTGANEGWVAAQRNPITLSVFPSLPSELAEQALSEFAGLVRSGFFPAAAQALAGPGWPIHERLLGRLAAVDEDIRRQFARILASKGIDDAVVPGFPNEPAHRF